MSVESEYRAVLAADAPLTAIVGTRIAQDAVPAGGAYPLVVFACSHDRQHALDGTLLYDHATLSVQCWAETGAAASALADAVIAASLTAPAGRGVQVLDRATTFDPELSLDGVTLTVDWWQMT